MDIKEKIQTIKDDERSTGRCFHTILDAILIDATLTDEELFAKVQKAYETGKRHSPSYIRSTFRRSMKWLKKNLAPK